MIRIGNQEIMSNKLSFIKGTVVSVSHIFYHSGLKTFFLSFNQNEEKKDAEPTFLMVQAPVLRTKDLHKILVEMQLNSNQFIGKKVMVENVTRNNLTSKVSQINLKVYLLTKTTTFEILEDISTFLPQPTSQNLVDYKGKTRIFCTCFASKSFACLSNVLKKEINT